MGAVAGLISEVPTPAWVVVTIGVLLLAGNVADALMKISGAAVGGVKAVRGLPLVRRKTGVEARRATRRRDFASEVGRELRNLEVKERWSDSQFTELEARVETERTGRFTVSALRFFTQRREVRVRRSLTRALAASSEPLILLQGDPGSGKSVALRHVALRQADKAARSRRVNSLIPLYINLKGLKREPGEAIADIGPKSIEAYVDKKLRENSTVTVEQFLDQEFEPSVADGTFFFLFDSFDEIPDILSATEFDETVTAYSQAISTFLQGMRKCRGVIASREFRAPEGLQWPTWKIVPLEERRRHRLIHKALLDRTKERLVRDGLRTGDPELVRLCANPLFLNLLCTFVDRKGHLPVDSHEVIEEYINQRLAIDEPRLVERFGIEAADLRSVAEAVAFCMAAEPALGLQPTRGELMEAVTRRELCECDVGWAGVQALEWVKLAQGDGSGQSDSDRTFTFAHRRFQEYFATCAVLDGRSSVSSREMLTDWRWRETAVTLLQLQNKQADGIVGEAAHVLSTGVGTASLNAEQITRFSAGEFAAEDEDVKPWPRNVPHVLDVLQSGVGAAVDRLPRPLREDATTIVARAFANGDTADQKQALEVAGVVGREVFTGMLRASFRGASVWLREMAYRQTARLDEVPSDVQTAISKMLVTMAAEGVLWRERFTTRAQLSRLRSRQLTQALDLALAAPIVDLAVHLGAVMLAIAASRHREAVSGGFVAFLAVPSFTFVPWRARAIVWQGETAEAIIAVVLRVSLVLLVGASVLPGRLWSGESLALLVLLYGLTWAPSAYLAVAQSRSVQFAAWPVLPFWSVVWLCRRLRESSVRLGVLGLIAGAASAGSAAWFIPLVNRLLNSTVATLLFVSPGLVIVPLGIRFLWRTTVCDLRWYRAWRREPHVNVSIEELLGWLIVQRTARGARRVILDLRLEDALVASDTNLRAVTDLARLTKACVDGRELPHERLGGELIAAWYERTEAQDAVELWGEAVDDDVAQLRETMSRQIARRENRVEAPRVSDEGAAVLGSA